MNILEYVGKKTVSYSYRLSVDVWVNCGTAENLYDNTVLLVPVEAPPWLLILTCHFSDFPESQKCI